MIARVCACGVQCMYDGIEVWHVYACGVQCVKGCINVRTYAVSQFRTYIYGIPV